MSASAKKFDSVVPATPSNPIYSASRHSIDCTSATTPSGSGPEHSRQKVRAIEILQLESKALADLAANLTHEFHLAVELILNCQGNVLVTGMGKAGLIGTKISATLSSTGTPSHFVHPAEAIHGDLGRFQPEDIVLVLSNSGETEEVVRLLPAIQASTKGVIAITASPESTLARQATVVLPLPKIPEACQHNLAPTTSTTGMLGLGDALALVVSEERGFAARDFARLHPGGALGNQLKTVDEVMRPLSECRVAEELDSIRSVLVKVAKPGRRTGAVMLVDSEKHLCGIFTDSDLAKLLESKQDTLLDEPIQKFMSRSFSAIRQGALLKDALGLLGSRKISELPVVDENDQPIGLIDVTDIVAWLNSQNILDPTPNFHQASTTPTSSQATFAPNLPPTIRLFAADE